MFSKLMSETISKEPSNLDQASSALEQFSGANQVEYYQQKNLQNWRKIETHSLFSAMHKTLGSLAQKSICDLGCGNGYYARECIDRGANLVKGYDLSEDMIKEANSLIKNPEKEKYTVKNVLEIGSDNDLKEAFDIVLVVYLWNYAENPEKLMDFMQMAFWLLKNGGVAFVVTDNKTNITDYRKFAKYGMFRDPNLIPEQNDRDGLKVDYIFGKSVETGHRLTNYRMSQETLITTAKKVGFSIKSHNLELPPELQNNAEDWKDFLDMPPIEVYSLSKPELKK